MGGNTALLIQVHDVKKLQNLTFPLTNPYRKGIYSKA